MGAEYTGIFFYPKIKFDIHFPTLSKMKNKTGIFIFTICSTCFSINTKNPYVSLCTPFSCIYRKNLQKEVGERNAAGKTDNFCFIFYFR